MSAFNGSGTFVISGSGLPFVTGTTISSTVANQLNTDLATGLSTCLTKDGQTTPTGNIPLGGFKVTGLAVATATGDALSYGRAATVTTLNTTGLLTASAAISTTLVFTSSGTVSLPLSTATTFTTLASAASGTWLVSVQLQVVDALNYGQLAIVFQDNGNLSARNLWTNNMSVSVSGLNLQATNIGGATTQTAVWTITRIA